MTVREWVELYTVSEARLLTLLAARLSQGSCKLPVCTIVASSAPRVETTILFILVATYGAVQNV